MKQAVLEHVNLTVTDPEKTAERLCDLFGWHVRWKGEAKYGGLTVHVGTDNDYLAVYSMGSPAKAPADESYAVRGGLNHIGVVVDDLEAAERRVKAAGYEPHSHADYEPGRRFYFDDDDGIEFEVVSYSLERFIFGWMRFDGVRAGEENAAALNPASPLRGGPRDRTK
ncbi:MAG: VOC family protein [Rhizobiaceae bacterium]